MSPFFDTHAHLNSLTDFPDYFCLNVTTDRSQWHTAIDIHHSHINILPALGIHPWFVEQTQANDLELLAQLLASSDVFAVGEIGLDFGPQYKNTRSLQIACFEQQLSLAKTHQLPVSLHCTKAHNEMIHLLKSYDLGKRGVLHGLGASKEVVGRYIDLGYKIGINAVVCRANARRYHEMVSYFDIEHFVLETDYPNVLLPGQQRADLIDIRAVAVQVSQLKQMSVDDVLEQTYYNAQQIFNR